MEGCLPLFGDDLLVLCAGFVVHNLEVHVQAFSSKLRHDCIVGCDTVNVLLAFEWLLKYEVSLLVVRYHDILIARSGSDGEASGMISVQFADWERFHEEERLFCLGVLTVLPGVVWLLVALAWWIGHFGVAVQEEPIRVVDTSDVGFVSSRRLCIGGTPLG